ncbi:MAG TPA: alcohol dehydrogenase catalytic domain-containing protein [Phycisphaerae bacterium]|nr:alcohol dehydrogenase catalytic domain-containing protein [Phycisphaerae bacterium]
MRALVVESGKAIVKEVPQAAPAPGEVLIQVRLAGICSTDLEILKGYGGYTGILGHEFVGTVVSGSTTLAKKRVVGEINCVCGKCDMCASGLSNHCRNRTVMGIQGRPGCFSEFVALPERNCLDVPDSVTDEEAVFAEPLAAAIQVTRQVKVETRMNIAVLGTGRLGLLVAQVLARTGCKLTAVGRNPATLAMMDKKRIRNATVADLNQWGTFDVVVDCTGSPEGLPLALRLVRPRGTIVMKTTCAGRADADLIPLVVNEVSLIGSRCGPMRDALNMLARKEIDVASMITRQLALSEGPAALALAAEPGHIKVLLKNA